ncbi:MAG: DUF1835 domain-containing protein, partial [Pseudomonadota bacterium]
GCGDDPSSPRRAITSKAAYIRRRCVAVFGALRPRRRTAGASAVINDGPDHIHLRCGSDIAPTLREAGFEGRFVEFSDPLLEGPLTPCADDAAWAAMGGPDPLGAMVPGPGAIAAQYAALDDLPHDAAITLWFEHDLYDQSILVYLLARFAAAPPKRLRLICVDRVDGVPDFRGLGQLSPDALRALWAAERRTVDDQTYALGQAAWGALQSPTPHALAALAAGATPALPPLAAALRRHLEELPWVGDDLARSERELLEATAASPGLDGHKLFDAVLEAEDAPFFTDLILRNALERLAPLITSEPAGDPWPKQRHALTPDGEAVLKREAGFFAFTPAPRWVGGIAVDAAGPVWRWDGAAAAPVFG